MSGRKRTKTKSQTPKKRYPVGWQMRAAKQARNTFTEFHPRGSASSKAMWGDDYNTASYGQKAMRRALRYSGPGDYKKYLRYIPRGLGAIGGGIMGWEGGPSGIWGGATKGWGAGAGLSKAIGWGDYSVNQIVQGNGPSNPSQSVHHISTTASDLSGDIVYSNSEFIKNIYVTKDSTSLSPFNNESFALNPGMGTSFPFLSQIANNFELYEFQGLMFQYKPNSGTFGNSNSNSLGKVILVTNYDPEAPDFVSAVQAENYDYANSCVPAGGMIHGVECKPSQRSTLQMYTRSGEVSRSKVFTDLGKLQLITQGVPFGSGASTGDEALIGELWVTYTVKFSRAKLNQYLGEQIAHARYDLTVPAGDLGAAAVTADISNHFSIVFTDIDSSNIQLSFPDSVKGKRLLLTCITDQTLAAGTVMALATLVNCTEVSGDEYSINVSATGSAFLKTVDMGTNDVSPSFYLDSTVAPGVPVIHLSFTIVDPDFTVLNIATSS
jgi:hypothetical protein